MYAHHILPVSLLMLLALSSFLTITLVTFDMSIIMEWYLLTLNSSSVSTPIMLDSYTSTFTTTVLFISYAVMTFSKSYMMGDQNLSRFTHLVTMFILSMIMFILSPNLISMMLGWDGLGITSFILVIYYPTSNSLKSGMITVLSNRVGDILLLISMAMLLSQGHWTIINMPLTSTIATLITLAAFTKSAQLPFSAWLPEAMAAPTPVSALVHSSTLVTAGVFLLIRMYPSLSLFSSFNSTLLISSTITMAIAGQWATTAMDVKKIIALSTLSQLGLMMTSLSLGMVTFCFFHLITHALFKATLFICAGLGFSMKFHKQTLGNLYTSTQHPLMGYTLVSALLSMNAMFFMAGFFSKDLIAESTLYNFSSTSLITLTLAWSIFTTAMYSTRIYRAVFNAPSYYYAFKFNNKKSKSPINYTHDNNTSINFIMMLLFLGCLTSGSIFSWMLLSTNTSDIAITTVTTKMTAPIIITIALMTTLSACRFSTKHKEPDTATNWGFTQASKKSKKWGSPSCTANLKWVCLPVHQPTSYWTSLNFFLKSAKSMSKLTSISFMSASPTSNLSKHYLKTMDQGLILLFTYVVMKINTISNNILNLPPMTIPVLLMSSSLLLLLLYDIPN